MIKEQSVTQVESRLLMETKMDSNRDPGPLLAMLLLRIWLGFRALQTGIEKFAGTRTATTPVVIDGEPNAYGLTEASGEKVYGLSHYQGVPESLYAKLADEPLIPGWLLGLYDLFLGPALVLFGLTLLLGIATRTSLFVMGLIYTSLTFGLILLKQDSGIAWLATHLLLIVAALVLAKHNRFLIVRRW